MAAIIRRGVNDPVAAGLVERATVAAATAPPIGLAHRFRFGRLWTWVQRLVNGGQA